MGSAIPKHKIRGPAIQTVHRRGTVRRSCGSIRFRCRFPQVWRYQFFSFIQVGLNALVLSVVMEGWRYPSAPRRDRMKGGVFSEPEHPV